MKLRVISLFVFAGLLVVVLSVLFVGNLDGDQPNQDDYTALAVCEGVVQLFKQFPESVWPGCDLSQRPLIPLLAKGHVPDGSSMSVTMKRHGRRVRDEQGVSPLELSNI